MKSLLFVAAAALASPVWAQASPAAGLKVFQARCASCHVLPTANPQSPRIGPSLKGVIGRKAGTAPGFTRYSRAMKAYGQTWTATTLDTYLANPRKVVPGTNMAFAGLPKPQDRAAVIAYLAKPVAPR